MGNTIVSPESDPARPAYLAPVRATDTVAKDSRNDKCDVSGAPPIDPCSVVTPAKAGAQASFSAIAV